jgi:hypothetical protein
LSSGGKIKCTAENTKPEKNGIIIEHLRDPQ